MILPSKKMLYSGTITGLRISSVDGTAFLDNCAVEVPEAQWVLKTSGNIAAGNNKLDYTATNAFVEFGVDISAYQTGRHAIKITDAAGKVAKGYISSTAPGGETLGAEAIPNNDMEADPITDWNVPATASMAIVADERDGGAGSQSIEVTRGSEERMLTQDQATVALTKRALYRFEGWLKNIDLDTGCSSSLAFYNGSWTLLYSWGSTSISATSWSQFVTYAVVPDYTYLSVQQRGVGSSGQKARVDDYSLKRLTDCAATGALIVSTLGGTTRSWTSVDTGFNPNTACTYEIYDATLTGLADGESDIYIYDSAGAFLKATLKAQGTGETLGGQLVPNYDFSGTWGANDVPEDWRLLGTPTAATYLEKDDVNNRLRLVSDGDYLGIQQVNIIDAHKLYQLEVDCESYVEGVSYFGIIADYITITSSGTQTRYIISANTVSLQLQRLFGFTSDMTFNSASAKQVLTPSTDGVTLQASKWDATENFGVKASGFKYNEASYAVRVYKVRG